MPKKEYSRKMGQAPDWLKIIVSWQIHELITRLHSEYPNTERSGMARVVKQNWEYTVTDIHFPEQKNSTWNTEMTKAWLDKFAEQLIENVAEDPHAIWEFNCRLHSHHSMRTFWSWTDEEAKNWFNDWSMPHLWSIVTAYKTDWTIDYKCALNVFKPMNIEFDVPVEVEEGFTREQYYKNNWIDYEEAKKQIQDVKSQYKVAIESVWQEIEINEEEKNYLKQLLNIFDDNVLGWIFEDYKEKAKQKEVEELEEELEEVIAEIMSENGIDYIEQKVGQLKKSVLKTPTVVHWWTKTRNRQTSMFSQSGEWREDNRWEEMRQKFTTLTTRRNGK